MSVNNAALEFRKRTVGSVVGDCTVAAYKGSGKYRLECKCGVTRIVQAADINRRPHECKHDPAARFWIKVNRRGDDECWPWTASCQQSGHGKFQFRGRLEGAHRVAWTLSIGKIPVDLCVCHHCDNPPCCNPAHLFLGTIQDNVDDMVRKGRSRYIAPPPRHGTEHAHAVLDEHSVRYLRAAWSAHPFSVTDHARKLGVSYNALHCALSRSTWRHVDNVAEGYPERGNWHSRRRELTAAWEEP